jgi:WD40 repeat protein
MLLASASVDTVINLWKVPKKGLTSDVTDSLVALTGHTDAVNVIEFHPTTGRLILSASKDGTVKLWDIEHKTALYSAESLANVTGISWNDLGSEFLLSSSTENAKIHDARNKNGITATLANTIGHKSMFLGGTDMIMALDSHNASIRLWDYRKSCAELATIDLPINPSHTLPPCYDADVKLLYLVDKSNRLFTVFDVGVKDTYLMTRQTFKSKNHGKAICMIPKRATNIGTA